MQVIIFYTFLADQREEAIFAIRRNALAFLSMRFCRLLRRRQVSQVGGTSCPGRCLGRQQGEITSFDLFTAAKCEFFPVPFDSSMLSDVPVSDRICIQLSL